MDNKKTERKGNKRSAADDRNHRTVLGIARRSIWYILRVVIILTVCLTLCYAALVEAMYLSNIYIITTEGMELRAACILGEKGIGELGEHFYSGWVLQDQALYGDLYDAYRVDTYDYRLSIDFKKIKVLPWSKTATLQATERVLNIQAEPYNDDTTEPVPQWQDSRMEITLEKLEGRWYITKLTVLEEMPPEDPRPTPDYSQLETDIPHY